MKLRELMTQNVQTCRPDSSLTEVAKIMSEIDCGFVPVVDGQKLAGVITDRDIILRAVAPNKDVQKTTARECMTTPVITAAPDMDAHAAANLMSQKQIRRLCVVEGERLTGVVALGDLATVQIHVNEAGEALSDISEPSRPQSH